MKLPDQIRQAIEAHARWAYPQEACGLIAADADGDLRMAYCLTNIEGHSSRFTLDPVEHFEAQSHAERHGWQIAGSFHSHPDSAAEPSAHDVAGALDPTWIYLIAGPVGASALAGDVGDVEGEAEVSLARTSDEGALNRAPRARTLPGAPLDVLNAADVAGRGTNIPIRSFRIRSGSVTEIDTVATR